MVEGQKKRQIGKGMKARGNKRVKPQKEASKVTDKSTVEGQQIPVPEAVLEVREGNETPGNLEPENGGESFQNLESPEKIVAHDEGLEAALKESGNEVIDAEFLEVDEPRPAGDHHAVGDDDAAADLETAMAVGTETVKDLQPPCGGEPRGKRPTITELEELLNKHGSEGVSLEPNGAVRLATGPQPDGTTKVIVTIQEGYWEAVQQWAEADGVPVEQWLSDRLYEYISTYGEPAKGR
jgi:uncharacterized protein YciI